MTAVAVAAGSAVAVEFCYAGIKLGKKNQTSWDITGQTNQRRELKLRASILTVRDLDRLEHKRC